MNKLVDFFNKHKLLLAEALLFIVIFIIYKVNADYLSYPDEFINLLGGTSINNGEIPYKSFFDHHLPFAWYLAAILLKISFNSYTLFRFWWAVVTFLGLLIIGFWIRKNHRDFYYYYLGFFILYPLLAVYFWFHLYLADSLAILFFSIIFWLLLVQTISKKVNYQVVLVSSLATFCLIFSSMTFLYLALVFYLWQLYLIGFKSKKIVVFFAVCAAPYIIYFIYLLLTKSLYDFYFANFVYNTKLYISIPNYVRGRFFNPLKFGLTLIYNFYGSYLPLLTKIKFFDLYLPVGVLAGLGSLTLLLLLLSKNLMIGTLFFFLLSFSAPRSDIQNYHETDYQGGLFIVLGVISAIVALYLLKKLKVREVLIDDLRRITQVTLAIFVFFTLIFLLKNTYDKWYQVYTQKMPHIYDLSYTADFLDQVLDQNDYYWVGPYEPQEEFFVKKPRLLGKYPTLLPQFREDNYLKSSFISQFEQNPPAVIIFRHEASIFMTPALEFGKFFLDWMSSKYTSIENIKGVNVLKSPTGFNLRTDLYLQDNRREELLNKLKLNGYIE